MEDYRPMVSSKCPRSYVHLMTQCLDRNPDKRPDFLGGQVNVVVELERLIYEEYAKMAASAIPPTQGLTSVAKRAIVAYPLVVAYEP